MLRPPQTAGTPLLANLDPGEADAARVLILCKGAGSRQTPLLRVQGHSRRRRLVLQEQPAHRRPGHRDLPGPAHLLPDRTPGQAQPRRTRRDHGGRPVRRAASHPHRQAHPLRTRHHKDHPRGRPRPAGHPPARTPPAPAPRPARQATPAPPPTRHRDAGAGPPADPDRRHERVLAGEHRPALHVSHRWRFISGPRRLSSRRNGRTVRSGTIALGTPVWRDCDSGSSGPWPRLVRK